MPFFLLTLDIQLLDSIMKSSKAKLFNEPVNWKLYNLLDYPTLVPDPMDLGTCHT